MGVAVRNTEGEMELLTGNQIGSLLLWYRLKQLFSQGILSDQNKKHAVIIKSLVTTELQKVIAEKWGVRCVETLTGFKYIGAKQEKYEKELSESVQLSYRQLNELESRDARLRSSSYFVFGGEESYGYNMGDFVRDKDGNASVLCFCEVAAYAASQGLSVITLLDHIYSEYGVHLERGESLVLEGADGANKMESLIESYRKKPFQIMNGISVVTLRDFYLEDICDSEGEMYPKEEMFMIKLEGNRQVVIRPSGTEPKIKFYLFTAQRPVSGSFSLEEVQSIKSELKEELEKLWQWLKEDLHQRIE
jgi:phosphoglucomutase